MKLLILLALFIPALTYAQLEIKKDNPSTIIGTARSSNSLIAELSYRVYDTDTVYTLIFKNMKYELLSDYQAIIFHAEGNTLNGLYDVLNSFFNEENKNKKDYQVRFSLGKEDISVSVIKGMGKRSVMFWTDKGYVIFDEKTINKVFGRG